MLFLVLTVLMAVVLLLDAVLGQSVTMAMVLLFARSMNPIFTALWFPVGMLVMDDSTTRFDRPTVTILLLLVMISLLMSDLWLLPNPTVPTFRLLWFRRWHLSMVACPVNLLLAIAKMNWPLLLTLVLTIVTDSSLLLLWNPTFVILDAVCFTGCNRVLLVVNWTVRFPWSTSSMLLLVEYMLVLTSLLFLLWKPTVTSFVRSGELHVPSLAPPIRFCPAVSSRHGLLLQAPTVRMLVTCLLGRKSSSFVMRLFPVLCSDLGSRYIPA